MDCHVASLLAMTGVFMESVAWQSRLFGFIDCFTAFAMTVIMVFVGSNLFDRCLHN